MVEMAKQSRKITEFKVSDLENGRFSGVYFKTESGNMYFLSDKGRLFDAGSNVKSDIPFDEMRTSPTLRVGEIFVTTIGMKLLRTSSITQIVPVTPSTGNEASVKEARSAFDHIAGGVDLSEFEAKNVAGPNEVDTDITYRTRQQVIDGKARPGDVLALLSRDGSYIAVAFLSERDGNVRVIRDRDTYFTGVSVPRIYDADIAIISNGIENIRLTPKETFYCLRMRLFCMT
ncbi:MAG: hypothetical protein KGH64_06245 [Candidatus Micrarchaeota archaeon]|nr:hypothetical protein [Candidatus Micrarchaeota archaeon]MDE1859149.1 hypothetical protein [Candidatus Micrarchaeota archaeon]